MPAQCDRRAAVGPHQRDEQSVEAEQPAAPPGLDVELVEQHERLGQHGAPAEQVDPLLNHAQLEAAPAGQLAVQAQLGHPGHVDGDAETEQADQHEEKVLPAGEN